MLLRKTLLALSCSAALFALAAHASPPNELPAQAHVLAPYAQQYQRYFDEASAEFNVPVEVLQAIAFAESRWRPLALKGKARKDAREPVAEIDWEPGHVPPAYGIMGLRNDSHFGFSLATAARLIGDKPENLVNDTHQNIRGAAALLASLGGGKTRFSSPEEWEGAIAKYSGIPQAETAQVYSYEVLQSINSGRESEHYKVQRKSLNLEKVYGKARHAALSAPVMNVVVDPKPAK